MLPRTWSVIHDVKEVTEDSGSCNTVTGTRLVRDAAAESEDFVWIYDEGSADSGDDLLLDAFSLDSGITDVVIEPGPATELLSSSPLSTSPDCFGFLVKPDLIRFAAL